jgi:elongation factor P
VKSIYNYWKVNVIRKKIVNQFITIITILILFADDMKITVSFLETENGLDPISFRLPQTHAYEVVSATSIISNTSKGTAVKVVEIRGGIQVHVPEFINVGDKIVITLNDLKYFKRA